MGFDTEREILEQWNYLANSLPILSVIAHPAVNVLILLVLILLVCSKKMWEMIFPTLPILVSILIIIAAPVFHGHPRYAFPIIYTMLVLLSYFVFLLHKKDKKCD